MIFMDKVRNTSKSTISNNNSYEFESSELRRGPWALEEDNLLIQYISCNGEGHWNTLAKNAGLKRTGKSCRLRWLNYLKPDIKRGNLTPQEQLLILELHSKWGNRWSKIAQHLPGRTDNEIKNYWRTRVQKQARQLKLDSNSNNFVQALRMFWKSRLLEKIEPENNPSPIISSPSLVSSLETKKTFTALSPLSYNQVPLPSSCPKPENLEIHYNSDSNFMSELPENVMNGEIQCENSLEDSSNHYDMQAFESQDVSMSECHVADVDWFGEDLGSNFWDTGELWAI